MQPAVAEFQAALGSVDLDQGSAGLPVAFSGGRMSRSHVQWLVFVQLQIRSGSLKIPENTVQQGMSESSCSCRNGWFSAHGLLRFPFLVDLGAKPAIRPGEDRSFWI
ncbi:hypothetical protein GCM10025790_20080 [Nesterenkonia rhizosphaerae]|uniref:Uncharacterized protein n=1 Tax=Nesterenkonia rhizosphaerae TaxID=1348272 RepID=A0ABP9G0B0_9MICC